MPRRRSDGGSRSAGCGRVKAVSRDSGSAKALALTRPEHADTLKPITSPLTLKTVASPRGRRDRSPPFQLFRIRSVNTVGVAGEMVQEKPSFSMWRASRLT